MIPIEGVFEVAIRVRDLRTSETFYREVLGLQVGLRDEERNWIFLRAGGAAGMVVLQKDCGQWPSQHFAFSVNDSELDRCAILLKRKGTNVVGPIRHQWIPGRSVYFSDPDGHALELIALTATA